MGKYSEGTIFTKLKLKAFVDKLHIGDRIELTTEVFDDDANKTKERHMWVVAEKYTHHMTVRRKLANGYIITKSVQYTDYYIKGNETVV